MFTSFFLKVYVFKSHQELSCLFVFQWKHESFSESVSSSLIPINTLLEQERFLDLLI